MMLASGGVVALKIKLNGFAPLDEEITYETGEELVGARHLSHASEVTPELMKRKLLC